MRYAAAKEFTAKLPALAARSGVREHVQKLIARIEDSHKGDLLSVNRELSALSAGIYVLRSGPVRLFFSIGKDDQGDYALLLDIAMVADQPNRVISAKDPRTNHSLNPKFNHSFNPLYNHSVNPMYNHSINPNYNHSINPNYNHSINPRFNTSLNPRYNTSLNPRFNASLNPRFNRTLNPRFNPAYDGPFIFDLEGEMLGYLVRANDRVQLKFTLDGEFQGVAVETSKASTVNLFTEDGSWSGYLVSAGSDRLLGFSPGGDWQQYVLS